MEQEQQDSATSHPSVDDIIQFENRVRTLYQLLRAQLMRELAIRKLSYSATLVLSIVTRQGDTSMGEIQRQLGFAHSTITGLVDTLHSRGLVERYPDPSDRRVTFIRPTELGHEEIQNIRAKRVEWLKAVWPTDLPREEFEATLSLLERLTDALSALKTREEPIP